MYCFSGLSGGQKRRVDVAVELVAAPSVAFLDEPTSGLDGSIAFDVLNAIRNTVTASKGQHGQQLSVMLAIHQPNSRILGLFDHILVLDSAGMAFFGTVHESIVHFTKIGFAPPEKYTVTDYYLKIIDSNFTQTKFDFAGAFNSSAAFNDLQQLVERVERRGQIEQLKQDMMGSGHSVEQQYRAVSSVEPLTAAAESNDDDDIGVLSKITASSASSNKTNTSFAHQVYILVARDYTIAGRDPSLYFLQFVLVLMFGFLIGACFFQLNYRIDRTVNYVTGSLLWIIMMMIYMQVFKVYHLMKAKERFEHEQNNNAYSVLAAWTADLVSVSTLLICYLPGTTIAYFMIGLPGKAFPFIMLLMWMVSINKYTVYYYCIILIQYIIQYIYYYIVFYYCIILINKLSFNPYIIIINKLSCNLLMG